MSQSLFPVPSLLLGTALWGWGIERTTAFKILDEFALAGGTIVDTASNYPINRNPSDFGLATRWLADWIKSNQGSAISVLVKVGATNNSGDSATNLRRDFILESTNKLQGTFGSALAIVSVHWDNRGEMSGDQDAISETVTALEALQREGLSIGLSGIRFPQHYYSASPSLADQWWIQVKENFVTSEARMRYTPYFPRARYIGYGINLGGIKLELPTSSSSAHVRNIRRPDQLIETISEFLLSKHGLSPTPTTINHLALTASYFNQNLDGIIIAPRTLEQLIDTMNYWTALRSSAQRETSPSSLLALTSDIRNLQVGNATSQSNPA